MTVREAYHAIRRRHPTLPAVQALSWARHLQQPRLDWKHSYACDGNEAIWRDGPFTFRARMTYDDDPDFSWLGTIWVERGYRRPDPTSRRGSHRIEADGDDWYIPPQALPELIRDLRRCGVPRGEAGAVARAQQIEDMRRLRAFDVGERSLYGIVVIAFVDKVELGRAACFGFDFDDPPIGGGLDVYADDEARELAIEAKEEALEQVQKILTAILGQAAFTGLIPLK